MGDEHRSEHREVQCRQGQSGINTPQLGWRTRLTAATRVRSKRALKLSAKRTDTVTTEQERRPWDDQPECIETSLAIETSFQRTGMPTIQTGRRNDLLQLDGVDLHRVQALCASKADLVVKGPLFPTFALISGISMWTRVMKLKFSIDEIKNVDLGHGGCSRSRASPAMIARLFLYRRILFSSPTTQKELVKDSCACVVTFVSPDDTTYAYKFLMLSTSLRWSNLPEPHRAKGPTSSAPSSRAQKPPGTYCAA